MIIEYIWQPKTKEDLINNLRIMHNEMYNSSRYNEYICDQINDCINAISSFDKRDNESKNTESEIMTKYVFSGLYPEPTTTSNPEPKPKKVYLRLINETSSDNQMNLVFVDEYGKVCRSGYLITIREGCNGKLIFTSTPDVSADLPVNLTSDNKVI